MNKQNNRRQQLISRQLFISCIVPAYNEQEIIVDFVTELQNYLSKITAHYEIIIVDDGSNDKTIANLEASGLLTNPNIKLLIFSRNFGKELALTAGLEHAKGDVTILIDADFQHPLNLIAVFLEHWTCGFDMVYGVRNNRNNESKIKRLASNFFYYLIGKLTKAQIPTNAGDFRLLDKKVVHALNSMPEQNRFMKGMYSWVGFKSLPVPFDIAPRTKGTSSWKFYKLVELAITGITSFSHIPLRMWGFIGLIIAFISFGYAIFIITTTLMFGKDMPGFATIIVAIMFLGGIQLLSIGILGEYVARIFNEVKNRPKYIIAEKRGFK